MSDTHYTKDSRGLVHIVRGRPTADNIFTRHCGGGLPMFGTPDAGPATCPRCVHLAGRVA